MTACKNLVPMPQGPAQPRAPSTNSWATSDTVYRRTLESASLCKGHSLNQRWCCYRWCWQGGGCLQYWTVTLCQCLENLPTHAWGVTGKLVKTVLSCTWDLSQQAWGGAWDCISNRSLGHANAALESQQSSGHPFLFYSTEHFAGQACENKAILG